MKLSILDQVPISTNQTAYDAFNASLKLAQAGERWGFTRYWVAEHHSFPHHACSAPEVLLGYIGAKTQNIRIGSGAILLPHYKPYKVAELANMLATLFPGRVDLGMGRAPGGSAEATNALSDHFLKEVWNTPEKLKELLYFLEGNSRADHPNSKVVATPQPVIAPQPWLLGTNKKSARLAAEYGLPYAFGLFMSESDGREILNEYRNAFKPRNPGDPSQVILTVSVLCAETTEKAERLVLSNEQLKK